VSCSTFQCIPLLPGFKKTSREPAPAAEFAVSPLAESICKAAARAGASVKLRFSERGLGLLLELDGTHNVLVIRETSEAAGCAGALLVMCIEAVGEVPAEGLTPPELVDEIQRHDRPVTITFGPRKPSVRGFVVDGEVLPRVWQEGVDAVDAALEVLEVADRALFPPGGELPLEQEPPEAPEEPPPPHPPLRFGGNRVVFEPGQAPRLDRGRLNPVVLERLLQRPPAADEPPPAAPEPPAAAAPPELPVAPPVAPDDVLGHLQLVIGWHLGPGPVVSRALMAAAYNMTFLLVFQLVPYVERTLLTTPTTTSSSTTPLPCRYCCC